MLSLVIGILACLVPLAASASPRPRIAIAPIQGDAGNKTAAIISEALAKDFVVIGTKETAREMTRLGLSDELGAGEARKLARKLDVVAVVAGTLTRADGRRSLRVDVHRRGRPASGFTIEFKTATAPAFRRGMHDQIVKKLEGGERDTDEDDDAPAARSDDDTRKRPLSDDDDAPRRKPADDDTRRARRGDDEPPRKRTASTDDDEPAVTRRKRGRAGDHAARQASVRVGGGASVAQRRLTFDTRAGFQQVPPRVITTAGAGRIEGEVYPFALAGEASGLAGLGLAIAYDRTFGLSIQIPDQTVRVPISQSHYAVGARYRLAVGEASTIALGLDYLGRHYIADRSNLMGAILDAPDVDYSAIAPGVAARTPVTPTIAIFAGADAMLVLGTGQIQTTTSYGAAAVYGLEAAGGVEIAFTRQIALRVAAEYSQISFSFKNKGAQANNRDLDATTQDVMGAVDRSIGVAATLGFVY